jgi:hypothetical protein
MMKFPSGKWGSRIIGKKALCGNRYLNILQKLLLDDRLSTPEERRDCHYRGEFWVLVDFTVYPDAPDYYIMSGSWLRRKIYEDHQNYLLSHGGKRPITPKSTHNKVILEDVVRWKDRWDILGLM